MVSCLFQMNANQLNLYSQVFSQVFQNTCEVVEKHCTPSENRYLRYIELMSLEPRRNALTLFFRVGLFSCVCSESDFLEFICVQSDILCNERWLEELNSWTSSWKILHICSCSLTEIKSPRKAFGSKSIVQKGESFCLLTRRKIKGLLVTY